MKGSEFDRLIKAAGLDSPSIPACRLVLVDGYTINKAAKACGVDPGAVSRMLKKLPKTICPTCGQAVQ